ncbi:MAG TPA: SRPBCC family protein [Sphingobacteriaceae bacterium]|nr:SRPBCC family protein [Sphingobacteriaceae bacterium]
MTVIENKKTINGSIEEVYNFLEDCNNHQQLQPENIYNWVSTKDEASFTIQNMAKLTLQIDKRTPNSEILLLPKGDAPFDVSIAWKLNPLASGTEVTLILKAELNMMLKMIASGPLQKLVDFQLLKLSEKFT